MGARSKRGQGRGPEHSWGTPSGPFWLNNPAQRTSPPTRPQELHRVGLGLVGEVGEEELAPMGPPEEEMSVEEPEADSDERQLSDLSWESMELRGQSEEGPNLFAANEGGPVRSRLRVASTSPGRPMNRQQEACLWPARVMQQVILMLKQVDRGRFGPDPGDSTICEKYQAVGGWG